MPIRKIGGSHTSNTGGTYRTPSVLDVGSKVETIPKKEIDVNNPPVEGN